MGKTALPLIMAGLVWAGTIAINSPQAVNAKSKSYDIGTEETSQFKESLVTANPAPKIPDDLQEDGCKTSVLARFEIASDGKTKVKLLTPSGSDEIDEITLDTLKKWKFSPATLDGKPIASTRKIKVEFEVN